MVDGAGTLIVVEDEEIISKIIIVQVHTSGHHKMAFVLDKFLAIILVRYLYVSTKLLHNYATVPPFVSSCIKKKMC